MSGHKSERKPATACTECGKVARRTGDLCADCLGYVSNELTGGDWVFDPVRRVQVYVPHGAPAPALRAPVKPRRRLADLVAERNDCSWWTAKRRQDECPVTDDNAVTVARRRRDLAEFYDNQGAAGQEAS